MKKKYAIITIVSVLFLMNIFQFAWNQFAYRLFTDAIPNEEVALEVGKAILVGAFGEGVLNDPIEAIYNPSKKIWVVRQSPEGGYLGSVPVVVIRQHDGKILKLYLT